MSLSDCERISGIMNAIHEMVSIKKRYVEQFPEDRTTRDIQNLIDQLWHAFIGKQSNSSHWLLGSSATKTITYQMRSVWGEAINFHCNDILNKSENKNTKDPFDAFEGFLDIGSLLGKEDKLSQFVYEIFAWSEQLVYYLRRYKDVFLSSHESLSSIVSRIQGECYGIFMISDLFARAYLVHEISKKYIYGHKYPFDIEYDPVLIWLNKDNLHHYIAYVMHYDSKLSLKDIAKIHKKFCDLKDGVSAFDRIKVTLLFSGRSFYHDHLFDDLKKFIQQHKLCSTQKVSELKRVFEQNKKQKIEIDKDFSERFNEDQNPTSIYGF